MRTSFPTALLGLVSLGLAAATPAHITVVDPRGREVAPRDRTPSTRSETFKPLSEMIRTAWPEARNLGVVCNYGLSREAVQNLADASPDTHILVVDVRGWESLGAAGTLLAQRDRKFLVLLPNDPVVRDGNPGATFLIGMMARFGVPTLGTTGKCIPQGALAALGQGTSGRLLINSELDKLQGYIEDIKGTVIPTN